MKIASPLVGEVDAQSAAGEGRQYPYVGHIIPNMGIKKLNLADVLFSKVQQRVLGILFTQPTQAFFTNEIIRLSHSGRGAVQRELEKLAASGIATITQVGNQKRYQANQDMPFFNELYAIVIKTFGVASLLIKSLEPLTKKISIAFIFGSIAKQIYTANSDIDLLIIGDNLNYSEIFATLAKCEQGLSRKVNPTFYSLSDWEVKNKSNNNFINQIKNGPKIFLIGTEEQLNELNKSS